MALLLSLRSDALNLGSIVVRTGRSEPIAVRHPVGISKRAKQLEKPYSPTLGPKQMEISVVGSRCTIHPWTTVAPRPWCTHHRLCLAQVIDRKITGSSHLGSLCGGREARRDARSQEDAGQVVHPGI
ncbi:hypothetical protein SKAU_G00338030 [Synaphobranchus kaupii]|uniref:Uncharacterized protein n=1 Tax=Synaphobranchus kaupii TaxID=118154 RepID=A0A9Q1EML5_SYNKA|nr:hypothetical protein SKAU_G00338030 [Synaphobranchus kaupii]